MGAVVGSDRRRRGLGELTAQRGRSKLAEEEAVCSPATTSQEASAHFCDSSAAAAVADRRDLRLLLLLLSAAAAVSRYRTEEGKGKRAIDKYTP